MSFKTVMITGCDQGIGKALVQYYTKLKWNVIGTTRDPEEAEALREANARIVAMDVSDEVSILNVAAHLAGERIDVLINNAGIMIRGGLQNISKKDLMDQLEVNAVGAFLVIQGFLPHLRSAVDKNGSALVINIGSRMGSISENTSGGLYGYRASKAALHMLSVSLAVDLKHEHVAVVVVHPGKVETEMVAPGELTPVESASMIAKLIDTVTMEDTGKFFHANGTQLPW
ncbi:hypothetical protein Poli38472_011432 [Pythium oligandrum]|uniref:Uncharacterized protein n=1 Tax=Pythium oligandrum TaxID=41045 RepID=A0A8K1CJE3_PYTOL|nr:hypothetical protein Poli38472_011432 [Pythium oligandrum]|eukprot:TMW64552.1 hypothetical protein Poli38472_011432 [Pythium oligandrum]